MEIGDMGILSFLSGGIVNSVEKIALEYIETDKETAEAKSLLVKTLDPNGKMRRDLSRFACRAYGFYLVMTTFLILAHAYGIGDGESSKEAIDAMTSLFLPITASWGTIVTASFGVNATNSIQER
jgi:hypothetical protein